MQKIKYRLTNLFRSNQESIHISHWMKVFLHHTFHVQNRQNLCLHQGKIVHSDDQNGFRDKHCIHFLLHHYCIYIFLFLLVLQNIVHIQNMDLLLLQHTQNYKQAHSIQKHNQHNV